MPKDQAFGVDFSNYAEEMTQDKVLALQAAGVRFAIIGYQDGALFEQQARALAARGIKVSAYFFIYWSRIATESARLTKVLDHLRLIEQTGVLFGWPRPDHTDMPKLFLDFEDDTLTTPPTNPAVVDARGYADLLSKQVLDFGFSCGVYTRENWWRQYTNDYTGLGKLPLWHASQYKTTVPIPFSSYFKPYGGWQVPMCWQYRGDVPQAGGWTADYNLEEWETGAVPPPAKTLTHTVKVYSDGSVEVV